MLDFFLKGDMSLEGPSEPCPVQWLIGSGWKDLLFLGGVNEELGALVTDFKTNVGVWKVRKELPCLEAARRGRPGTSTHHPPPLVCVFVFLPRIGTIWRPQRACRSLPASTRGCYRCSACA